MYVLCIVHKTSKLSLIIPTTQVLAVLRPLYYRTRITTRVCLMCILIGWAIGCLVTFGIILSIVLTGGDLMECYTDEYCVDISRKHWAVWSLMVVASYFSVIVGFLVLDVALLVNGRRQSRLSKRGEQNHATAQSISFLKLALSFSIFSLGYAPLIVMLAYFVVYFEPCFVVKDSKRKFQFVVFAHSMLLVKNTADPLVEFAIDRKLRRVAVNLLCGSSQQSQQGSVVVSRPSRSSKQSAEGLKLETFKGSERNASP